jgi:3alpha(or 20beta)-hydroxysteroid dehydrogenase
VGALQNRVVLVTGAARGIGEATARRFIREGASVILTDIRDEIGQCVAGALGSSARFVHHDVSSESDWARVVDVAIQTFGKLDGLVNNAAVFEWCPLVDYPLEKYRRMVDVNQVGVFLGMRSVVAPMKANGGGTIVNVSSVNGLVGLSYSIAYAAAKFAVTGMTKSAALELQPLNIRVNSVHPGLVRTPLTTGSAEERGTMPSGFQGGAQPDAIANLICYLTSDESYYSTGSHCVADGGVTCGMPGIDPSALSTQP